jgi:hypothetical protein
MRYQQKPKRDWMITAPFLAFLVPLVVISTFNNFAGPPAQAQTSAPPCQYTLKQSPGVGTAILVYRNGLLQNPITDYTITGRLIDIKRWSQTDVFQYVYARPVLIVSSQTTQYSPVMEFGSCVGNNWPPGNSPAIPADPSKIIFGIVCEKPDVSTATWDATCRIVAKINDPVSGTWKWITIPASGQ